MVVKVTWKVMFGCICTFTKHKSSWNRSRTPSSHTHAHRYRTYRTTHSWITVGFHSWNPTWITSLLKTDSSFCFVLFLNRVKLSGKEQKRNKIYKHLKKKRVWGFTSVEDGIRKHSVGFYFFWILEGSFLFVSVSWLGPQRSPGFHAASHTLCVFKPLINTSD